MRINHNIAALNAWRGLKATDSALNKSLEKLSSGLRINRAADDAAGLAISEKMRGQIKGLNQAMRNAQDGISLLQTAEGALNETHSILQRMRELAAQASNDTYTSADRAEIQKEIDQLKAEIDRIGETTEFNTKKLLNGDLSSATSLQASVWNTKAGLDSDGSGTAATGATTLDSIYDGNGNPLGLQDGDTITIEVTVNGTLQTTTFAVSDITTDSVGDILTAVSGLAGVSSAVIADGATDYNGDGTNEEAGSIVVQGNNGLANAITSVRITAVDGSGNERTEFNKFFSNIVEIQSAQDNTSDGSAVLQIGANGNQELQVNISDMRANALGIGGVDVSSQQNAENAIAVIDNAISDVSAERSKLGAYQNRLEHTINNLGVAAENLTAAESRIRDVDMAAEMMNFTKQQILSQAGTAMLAQANARPQSILQLLG